MSQTTYQVILSADGKHQVIVTTDNQGETTLAPAWAKATYAKLVRGEDAPGAQPEDLAALVDRELGAEPPECAAHHIPMVWVEKGKRGPFWSCREKGESGGW